MSASPSSSQKRHTHKHAFHPCLAADSAIDCSATTHKEIDHSAQYRQTTDDINLSEYSAEGHFTP